MFRVARQSYFISRTFRIPTISINLATTRSITLSKSVNMRIVQFSYRDAPSVVKTGYMVSEDKLVDVSKADETLPGDLISILKAGKLNDMKSLPSKNPQPVSICDVTLRPPVSGMDKVVCVGLNYQDHCDEQKIQPPEVPMFFSKWPSCVIGPGDAVRLRTSVTKCVDWEVELVVVMGREASNLQPESVYDYVLGYTVAQDISARDWQKKKNAGQFLLGKAMDTFCPIGPCIVTADEIADPHTLDISCSVNGVLKQSSNTCQLVKKIPDLISRLTSVMTLLPGDIILTGTPGGVGMYRDPPEYLKPGDILESEIQCIGKLVTRVVEH